MSKVLPKGGSALSVCRVTNTRLRRALQSHLERALGSKPTKQRSQITGNSGLNYAAWQLSRRGWHVMPTIRNARGSDLIVCNDDETVFFGVQSKALSKRHAVPLGRNIDELRSEWWVITIYANSDSPVCFVLRNADVRRLASQDKNGGAYWLEPPAYDQDEFREGWERICPNQQA